MNSWWTFVLLCFSTTVSVAGNLPDGWLIRSSPSTNRLNAIAYGNGLFLAVGSQATILTSSNGSDWVECSTAASPALFSAAYGNGRFVIGGEGGLIRLSTNGITWSNVLSAIGAENINGLTWGYNEFVAVGGGSNGDAGCIFTSSNGLDWVSRTAPTTNALFAVSPAYAQGIGWADFFYVAVGERGTILTSTNGVDWVSRDSGTTVPLRTVVWHGGFRVGGDSGIILHTASGVTWTAAAPPSFNVRSLTTAGLGGAIVAAGGYNNLGRIHASLTEFTWPGYASEFARTLNGVAFGNDSFVAVGDEGLIVQSIVTSGATNDWTKPTSGNWEEAYWSLGVLPASDQDLIAFRNPGFKALAIDANTTADYPNSLSIQNLLVEGPNQLLLNWAGLDVPLVVRSNLVIGGNGSLASHFSALQAGNFLVSGPVSFSDSATAIFDRVRLGIHAGGVMNLTNASIVSAELDAGCHAAGMINQVGGTFQSATVNIPATNVTRGDYFLSGGYLLSSNLTLGKVDLFSSGAGYLHQLAGAHTNSRMMLWGDVRPPGVAIPYGFYTLSEGLLASDAVTVYGGKFVQDGGSNYINDLTLQAGGIFLLNGGVLVTSNATLKFSGSVDEYFSQTGGVHTVQNRLLLEGTFVRYALSGGTLTAPDIHVGVNAQLRLFGGVLSNSEVVMIEGAGSILAGVLPNIQLGKLQITNTPFSPAGLDMNPSAGGDTFGPTVIRFRDSRDVPWSGALEIRRWTQSAAVVKAGPDHVFIGTNSQGLTSAQLSQITFVDPYGWPAGSHPATLLSTGELVPALLPPITLTAGEHDFVLSWTGDFELTSATNIIGPFLLVSGATSPMTNAYTDPQRFFRLRLPSN